MSNGVTVDPNGVAGLTFDEAGSSAEAKRWADSSSAHASIASAARAADHGRKGAQMS
jgi:hypothetical protein